jgi:hypothetical protein
VVWQAASETSRDTSMSYIINRLVDAAQKRLTAFLVNNRTFQQFAHKTDRKLVKGQGELRGRMADLESSAAVQSARAQAAQVGTFVTSFSKELAKSVKNGTKGGRR